MTFNISKLHGHSHFVQMLWPVYFFAAHALNTFHFVLLPCVSYIYEIKKHPQPTRSQQITLITDQSLTEHFHTRLLHNPVLHDRTCSSNTTFIADQSITDRFIRDCVHNRWVMLTQKRTIKISIGNRFHVTPHIFSCKILSNQSVCLNTILGKQAQRRLCQALHCSQNTLLRAYFMPNPSTLDRCSLMLSHCDVCYTLTNEITKMISQTNLPVTLCTALRFWWTWSEGLEENCPGGALLNNFREESQLTTRVWVMSALGRTSMLEQHTSIIQMMWWLEPSSSEEMDMWKG